MKAKNIKTVQFKLDETEKEILEKAWKILRTIKNGFLIYKMENHKEEMDKFMKLLNEVIQGNEINEVIHENNIIE